MKKEANKSNSSTESRDEAFFEDYLQGKSQLSALYQNIDQAEPSADIDKNIFAAARKTSSQKRVSKHWWTQPGSWAASIALFSLVALLTSKTWQEEQILSEQDFLPESPVKTQSTQADIISSPISVPSSSMNKAKDEISRKRLQSPKFQAKKSVLYKEKNDSRKLIYQSRPAPALQAAPERKQRSQLGALSEQFINNTDDSMHDLAVQNQSTVHSIKEQSLPEESEQQFSDIYSKEQQIWFDKIRQLIKKDKLDEAHELLRQFRIKYPDTPIEPVIIQSSPQY